MQLESHCSTSSAVCRSYQQHDLVVGQAHAAHAWRQEAVDVHDCYMLEYVLRGRTELFAPATPATVIPGYYACFAPGQEHSEGFAAQTDTLVVGFAQRHLDALATEMGLPAPPVLQPGVVRAAPGMRLAFDALWAELAQPQSGSRLLLESLCLHVVIHSLRADQPPVLHARAPAPEIRRSLDFIHAHLCEELTLEQVAAAAALSRYHFLRLFKRQVGLTPHAYIRQQRLNEAAHLLRSTSLDIGAIAAQLGFASPSHLSTAFRAHYQLAPSQFRRHHDR